MDDLKLKQNITRTDIGELLASIAPPGEKRTEKMEAVKQLEKENFQGIKLEQTLDSYREW